MLRLFLAVDLPPPVRKEVEAMCTQVSKARWVKPHQLHITLRFMGQTPDDALADIRERLSHVHVPAFPIALQSAGIFPTGADMRRARVLWLGLDPLAPLVRLKREIDSHLGVDDENQGFSPHLTLARFTDKPDPSLAQFISQRISYCSAVWTVACFQLYQSTLHASGAVHNVVASYPLIEPAQLGEHQKC